MTPVPYKFPGHELDNDPFGAVGELANPATGFEQLPDGVAMPIHRPLATDYSLPDRGTEAHGVDNDTPSDEMTGNDDILTGPPEPYDGDPYIQEVHAPIPVPVNVISQPLRSELVFTDLQTVIGPQLVASMPVGPATFAKPVLAQAVQALPYDDTRTRAEFTVRLSHDINSVNVYGFALSTSREFDTYTIVAMSGDLGTPGLPVVMPASLIVEGKAAIWAAPVSFAFGAPGASAVNATVLSVNVTRRQLVNETL